MATGTITGTNRGASPHTPRLTKKQGETTMKIDGEGNEMRRAAMSMAVMLGGVMLSYIMLPGED